MSLSRNEINEIIEKVQKQLLSYNKALEVIFLPHKTGKRKHACLELMKGYSEENIYPSIKKLLSVWMSNEKADDNISEFLGTIITKKKNLGGFIQKNVYLNIVAINVDTYEFVEELEVDLYKLCWNACNALKNKSNKDSDNKYRILVPNPKDLRKLGNNLQADIFSSLTYSLLTKTDYVTTLGKKRAASIIGVNSYSKPENYPFIMTLDQTNFMLRELTQKRKLNINVIEQAWESSKIILKTMNQEKLAIWKRFATHAQDMAWRGFPSDVIFSITIDRNDEIETKKLGVQLSALTNIKPAPTNESSGYYNPFKNDIENAELHISLIDEVFENLLTRSIFENSSKPLLEKAAEQNMKLKKGQFMGWCASALQEAADVFEKSLKAKQPPTQTTREIFKSGLSKTPWNRLKDLGEDILKLRRKEKDIHTRDFISFLSEKSDYHVITESVVRSSRKHKNSISDMHFSNSSMEEDYKDYMGRPFIADQKEIIRH